MLEHNGRKVCQYTLLLLLSTALSSAVAAKKEDSKKKQKNSVGAQTVGEVLKNIERKTKEVEIKKSTQALPAFKKAAPQQQQSVNLGSVKPPRRSTMYYEQGTNEAKLEKVTDQGISQLFKLTQQFKNSPRRGELWLRLAELYVEKARLIEFKLQQEYDKQVRAFNEEKTKTRPHLDLKPAQEYNLKAIQLYEWFLNDFPKDPKVDQALFFLGYNFFELNKAEKGKGF